MTSDCCRAADGVGEVMGIDGSCRQISSAHIECPAMSQQTTSVSSSPIHHRKLERTMEAALSLVSVRALLALMLWYLFSFAAIFLNKYVVDMLNAEMIIFCKYSLFNTLNVSADDVPLISVVRYLNVI